MRKNSVIRAESSSGINTYHVHHRSNQVVEGVAEPIHVSSLIFHTPLRCLTFITDTCRPARSLRDGRSCGGIASMFRRAEESSMFGLWLFHTQKTPVTLRACDQIEQRLRTRRWKTRQPEGRCRKKCELRFERDPINSITVTTRPFAPGCGMFCGD